MNPDNLINRPVAAKTLGITVRRLDYLVAQQRISFIRIGRAVRFRPESVQDYIVANTTPVFVQPVKKPLSALDLKLGRF